MNGQERRHRQLCVSVIAMTSYIFATGPLTSPNFDNFLHHKSDKLLMSHQTPTIIPTSCPQFLKGLLSLKTILCPLLIPQVLFEEFTIKLDRLISCISWNGRARSVRKT